LADAEVMRAYKAKKMLVFIITGCLSNFSRYGKLIAKKEEQT
jgi:hypothetical protein